jgi:hypothetical protein
MPSLSAWSGDEGKFLEFEACEIGDDLLVGVDAMGVEHDFWFSDGRHEEEGPAASGHALEFGDGFEVALWIERVAVAAQADMFDGVHAGTGFDDVVLKGQGQQAGFFGLQAA